MAVILVLLWLIAIAQGFAIIVLVRQLADLKVDPRLRHGIALEPLEIGAAAPAFEAVDVRSKSLVSSGRWRGRRIVMLFLSLDCGLCRQLRAEIVASSLCTSQELLIYGEGSATDWALLLPNANLGTMFLTGSHNSVAKLFGISNFPVAVSIDERWKITDVRKGPRLSEIEAMLKPATISVEEDAA